MALEAASGTARQRDGRCYVYMVRCSDGSLYTGVTSDVSRRLSEHLAKGSRAARYTRSRTVVGLAMLWRAPNRSAALSLEWHIHHLIRRQKERLVAQPSLADEVAGRGEGDQPGDDGCPGKSAARVRTYRTVPSNWRRSYWERAVAATSSAIIS